MDQSVVRTSEARLRLVPPIIDEEVERLERIDPVPPVERDVDAVAGLEQRGLRRRCRLPVSRESVEIWPLDIDQADRSAGRGELERARIEIGQLLGRKD